MRRNLLLNTDSYKPSHYAQFPPNTTGLYHYLESRGGRYGGTVFFGLQQLMMEYLEGPVFTPEDIDEAAAFWPAHGEPFNEAGFRAMYAKHGGRLPIEIRAVAEGTYVPTHNALMDVRSTDPEFFWVGAYFEDSFVRLWAPITVATQSWDIKRDILGFLQETADDPMAEIPFKLHDFGARGVSSLETAGICGMAHLVNFMGSDTVEGIRYANHYYKSQMAAFSIPAAEHSTITSWGREGEVAAYRNMLRQFAKPKALVAVVSDSYNVFNAVEHLWCGSLLDEVKASGATVVIRPDSGVPSEVVLKLLNILDAKVGTTTNTKGYKVLPSYFRLIQGDGVNQESIREILTVMKNNGFSASNIAFGMGGALLQKLDRDTQKFAFKCAEATVDGRSVKVFKDPVTDPGKRSKSGRLSLIREGNNYRTVEGGHKDDLLVPVYHNGQILKTYTLDEVRKNAMQALV